MKYKGLVLSGLLIVAGGGEASAGENDRRPQQGIRKMIDFQKVLLCISLPLLMEAGASPLPQAQVRSGRSWLDFGCRTLDSIDDYTVNPANLELSKYGGWKARNEQGSGRVG